MLSERQYEMGVLLGDGIHAVPRLRACSRH
jgi:hypothetical protein